MKRLRLSLASSLFAAGIAVSMSSAKPIQAGFFSWDGASYTYRGSYDPGDSHCLVPSCLVCYEEREENGLVILIVLGGSYEP